MHIIHSFMYICNRIFTMYSIRTICMCIKTRPSSQRPTFWQRTFVNGCIFQNAASNHSNWTWPLSANNGLVRFSNIFKCTLCMRRERKYGHNIQVIYCSMFHQNCSACWFAIFVQFSVCRCQMQSLSGKDLSLSDTHIRAVYSVTSNRDEWMHACEHEKCAIGNDKQLFMEHNLFSYVRIVGPFCHDAIHYNYVICYSMHIIGFSNFGSNAQTLSSYY